MKKSVLVLGNSHVAALRRGWSDIADEFPDREITFFAANAKLFNKLELNDAGLFGILNKAKYTVHQLKFLDQVFGVRTIDLKKFDYVLIVGKNSNEVDFLRQFEAYSIDGVREIPDKPSLSYEAFSSFCNEIALKRLPDAIWQNWDTPHIAFLPAPVPCADCPEDDPRYDVWARYGANSRSGLPFLQTYRTRVATLYQDHNITLLFPPDEVYDESGLTRVEFGDEATRLHPKAGTFEDNDFHHMSPKYGQVVLRHILETLG